MTTSTESVFVYIIDDDESVRKSMSRLMRSAGIVSSTYDSAKCFLSGAYNDHNSCIIMDINMPQIDGFELCARLKKRDIKIPVIAVSAIDDDLTRQRVQDMGVHFYLRKPVDEQVLFDAISSVIQYCRKKPNF